MSVIKYILYNKRKDAYNHIGYLVDTIEEADTYTCLESAEFSYDCMFHKEDWEIRKVKITYEFMGI